MRCIEARWILLSALFWASATAQAQGAIDVYRFDTPEQEMRYKHLTAEFRCPKCLNTNLAGSDAPIAADLRREVHDLLLEGKTDQEIRDFLQHRYGDFVLYNPPVRPNTWLLWFGPLALLLLGGWLVWRISRERNRSDSEDRLSQQDQARLKALTGEDGSAS